MSSLFDVSGDPDDPGWESRPLLDDVVDSATAGQSRAGRSGAEFKLIARRLLVKAGAQMVRSAFEVDGYPVDDEVQGPNRQRFLVMSRGTPDDGDEPGLRRTDTIEKLGYRALQVRRRTDTPILVVTSHLPTTRKARIYLADLSTDIWDVVAWPGDFPGFQRLHAALNGPVLTEPLDAPWRHRPEAESGDQLTLDLSVRKPATDSPAGRPAHLA